MTQTPHSSLSILQILEDFVATHREERISVRQLVNHVGEHGLLLLLLIFALFCAIPLPIPGIHVFLSMPLFYVTIQQMAGRRTLWLPDKVLDSTLPRHGFVTMVTKITPWFTWLSSYLKPRMQGISDGIWYRIMGFVALFITCIIVIPLPLTNVVPSLSIAMIALGMLCRDGIATLIGTLAGLLWCAAWIILASVIGWAGMKGIYSLLFT